MWVWVQVWLGECVGVSVWVCVSVRLLGGCLFGREPAGAMNRITSMGAHALATLREAPALKSLPTALKGD